MSANAQEPTRNELVNALRRQSVKHASVTETDPEEAARILETLASRFVETPSRRWWWEALKVPAEIIPYGDLEQDGLALLAERIPGALVYVIVSDNELPPWAVFRGEAAAILEMIGEVWFFEYAIANESLSWLSFDTHQNRLLICQDACS